jgi:acetolactate synthase-1/2/3 large subunit
MKTASDIIAERLYDAGCRYAFGVPGGEVVALIDALKRVGIQVILTRHENCAGFAGEGVHHFDGAPAILFGTIGPGIANAVNVIANATQDRVPMIALTGSVAASERHTYTHQVFDHARLLEPVTKAAFLVDKDNAGVLIDKALKMATSGRPGAVLVDVPVDVQRHKEEAPHPRSQPLAKMRPANTPDLAHAKDWLQGSERPLVIAGVDVINEGANEAVAAFCEHYQIPLITSYKAKGILPEDHPLALGGAGLSPKADTYLMPLIEASDCIILVGYDPIEMRVGWRDPWPLGARVIEISSEMNTHFMHQAAINFVGDIACALRAFEEVPEKASTWSDGEIDKLRQDMREAWRLDETWGPAAIVDILRQELPRDAVVTTDSGAHRILLSQAYQTYRPRGLLQSSALCTMGSAVPLALGRKLAEPSAKVVATLGDGGLEMFLGELATIRDLKLGIPIVVFVDEQLALIEMKQRGMGFNNLAVEFGSTDFASVADALGGVGIWCSDRESLSKELIEAFARDTFTILACPIGKQAYDGRF